MSAVYLSCLVFGGILILMSILFGGESDKSIEADKDSRQKSTKTGNDISYNSMPDSISSPIHA